MNTVFSCGVTFYGSSPENENDEFSFSPLNDHDKNVSYGCALHFDAAAAAYVGHVPLVLLLIAPPSSTG